MYVTDLKQGLEQLKATYNSRLGQKKAIETQIGNLEGDIVADKIAIADLEAIRVVLQETSDEARKAYSDNLAAIVTSALQHTFGADFRLIIEHKESRGKPETHFYVEHELGGKIVRNVPEKSMGGGVVDIVAFALQVAVKKLCKDPAQNGPMVTDEPAKMVSQNFAIKLGQFIQYISKEFDMQIIGVTHQQYLADQVNKCLDVAIVGDTSVVKEKVPVQVPMGP